MPEFSNRDRSETISHARGQSYARRPIADVHSHEVQAAEHHISRATSPQAETRALVKTAAISAKLPRWSGIHHRLASIKQFKPVRYVWQPEIIMAGVILMGVIVPALKMGANSGNYDLAAAHQLLSSTPKDLMAKLKFDARSSSWQFNQSGSAQLPSGTGATSSAIGGVPYSATLPMNLNSSSGLTLTDTASKLNISFKPNFAVGTGQSEQGHVVYPINGGKSQLVYTIEKDGVKEDIILYSTPGDTAKFSYKLDLPAGLEARLQSDGSIGVFGGDPSLFGNISYGSDKDKNLVEKAREHSKKDHLYYIIPAPAINGDNTGKAKAKFELAGNNLMVNVSGLDKAHYPLSIDPSFIMSSTSCGWQKGDNQGDVSYGGCSLSRSTLSGGTVGSWTQSTSTANGNMPDSVPSGMVAVNGYLYALAFNNSPSYYNAAYYAPINPSTGAVGTFVATSSMQQDRRAAGIVAANGYIYAIGDLATGKTVEYAKIKTDGSLSAWAYTSSMNQGRWGGGQVAYNNGRLYVVSGCIATLGSCTTWTPTTEYATIRGDGTLSAWTASTSTANGNLPAGTGTGFMWSWVTAYNNYLYIIGGQGNVGIGVVSTIYYAPINSDGSVGAWADTGASLPTVNRGPTAIASNGYMYIMGGNANGNNTTTTNATYIANIYANGKLGPLRQTTSFNTARANASSALYNGRIYIGGGCDSMTAGKTCYQTTEYTTISTSPGGLSPVATNANSVNGVYNAATVISGGYMYLLGGSNLTDGSFSNKVYYAQLNPDGSTGAWNTTSAFTDARSNLAAVAYNGYIYIAGGNAAGSTANCFNNGGVTIYYCRDIQKAVINADGTLGAWSSAGGVYAGTGNDGRAGMGMAVYGGYMYIIGGNYNNNSAVSTEVDVAPINSDGTVGTWVQNPSALGSTGRSSFGIAQSGKYVYIAGGRTQGGSTSTYNSDVIFATLSSGGGMSAWASAGPDFTLARSGPTASVSNGYLYLAAGDTAGGGANVRGDVQYIKINQTTGSLSGSWTTSPVTFTNRGYQQGATYNGYLYLVGGCANVNLLTGGCFTPINGVEYAQIYNNAGGRDGTWTETTALPAKQLGNLAVASNGYMYSIGGCSQLPNLLGIPYCGAVSNVVNYTKINADGSLGASWTATSPLTDGNYLGAATAYNGRIYIVGGCTASNSPQICTSFSNGVQYATICTGSNSTTGLAVNCGPGSTAGTLSSWQYATTNFNGAARWWDSVAVTSSGRLYMAGGAATTNGGTAITDATQVQYAQINSDGSVSSWTNATTYATPRSGSSLQINGDYLYILGGISGTLALTDVQYAKINTDGSLGAWQQTSSLSKATGNGASAISNGYLYVWNGTPDGSSTAGNTASNYMSTLQYAPIFANGTLGNWMTTPGYTNVSGAVGHVAAGTTIYNGYIYTIGGAVYINNPAFYYNGDTKAYYAPLQSQPQVAHYSIELTTDQPTLPANFFANTSRESSISSSISIGASLATIASPSFGSPVYATNPSDGVKSPITSNGQVSYYWLPITIDDSQAMAFGETSGGSINYFQLNYHPNAGMRLRGGQTFNGNQLQSLDAP